jgi:hypothetical protein
VLKRILLRVLLYPAAIIIGSIAMVLVLAAFPWLPGAFFLALLAFGFLGGIVAIVASLGRVFWWV